MHLFHMILSSRSASSFASGCLLCVCREVGIECQEVPGHSKGIGYRQGHSLKNVKSDHLWNAVLLGGQWFLLDACWGAGRVDMQHESFVKRLRRGSNPRPCIGVGEFELTVIFRVLWRPAVSSVSNQSAVSICCLQGLMISISSRTRRSSSIPTSPMRRNGSSWTCPSLWRSLREESSRHLPSLPWGSS